MFRWQEIGQPVTHDNQEILKIYHAVTTQVELTTRFVGVLRVVGRCHTTLVFRSCGLAMHPT